ncbi:ImpA family metalloprotease [Vibrio sp. S4B1]|nr:ImpA family metalloprotease [Vibrio methylphosphonaticus]MCL9775080.1 ImpA family metalloprotease [Vibrio methylphosphonaticus]
MVAFLAGLVGCGDGSDSETVAPTKTPVQLALESGDASLVDDANDFIHASQSLVATYKRTYNGIKNELAQDSSGRDLSDLHWDPTHDAAILSPTYGFNDTILTTNKAMNTGYDDKVLSIGVAGITSKNVRYAALGSNPFRTKQRFPDSVNQPMEKWVENLLQWVMSSNQAPKRIVLAQFDQSHYFPDAQATRNWLTGTYSESLLMNGDNECDGALLLTCLQDKPDVLMLSQKLNAGDDIDSVLEGVDYALEHDIPVLYFHLDGGITDLGSELFERLHISYVGDNYWRKLGLTNWDPVALIDKVPDAILQQQALLQRLELDNFSVDLRLCDDKSCEIDSKMAEQFYPAADSIRQHLNRLDNSKVDLFGNSDYAYEKLLVLLADHYRQSVQFPMDKNSTDTLDFLKSYFSDYTQYHTRKLNPAQPSLGNFSTQSFEDTPLVNKVVSLESKRSFRSAGVYAIPGQTFKVTRRDNHQVTTSIVLNTLRSGATHEFSSNGGYARPKFLTSTSYQVEPGETIYLTSAYGGTVQVQFDANDVSVELYFENVAQHPVWRSEADNDAFIAQLKSAQFDWAELITPGFEVHSKADKMLESVSSTDWVQPQDMALATERYMHNFPHALAGFQGPGIDTIDEIHQYGKDQGWTTETIDIVKHMNADQATCGYGCSGNPYDAYWAFHPLGHGDLHELGHGLEKGRFRFIGWDGHSTTNYYSYYSKSRYYVDTGKVSSCQGLDFKGQFELLQQSRLQADPNAFMAQQNQMGWSWGARVYIQMMMSAQQEGILKNGWHLLGRLHLIEREFTRLKSSETLWEERKASIGFAHYSQAEANALNNNDWLLVALSYITQRDMRNYLDMWGFSFTDKALQQVATMSLDVMPMTYFATSSQGYCLDEFATNPVSINGSNVWPLN